MRYFSIRFIAVALTLCVAGGLNAQRARNPIDRANFDTTCAACADFYTFANGGWLKRSTIPAAYSSWGSFNEVQDKNELVVRDVIEAAVTVGKIRRNAAGVERLQDRRVLRGMCRHARHRRARDEADRRDDGPNREDCLGV